MDMADEEEATDEDSPDPQIPDILPDIKPLIKSEVMDQKEEVDVTLPTTDIETKSELLEDEMAENPVENVTPDPQDMGDSLMAGKTDIKKKEKHQSKVHAAGPPRSTCRPRSRDPRRCQKHFREMIGMHEIKNEELEKREGDLRQRLEMLECSMPAVMVWNIWRMAQGAPVPSIRRVVEKQFQGFASGSIPCPSTPSQHYDCRVREVEAERKQAQRRADEARALWAEKEVALEEQKRKLEEARKTQALHKERIEKLTVEVQQMRKIREEEKTKDSCQTGECGEIRCKQMWLGDVASTTSVKSTDLECLARLQDLAEAELCMKRHITELERREETYMRTLQQADELWSKMEGDAASTMSGLQEQLELKTSANQQLADKVCSLEDAMEKMNKKLANCKNELGKFVGIEHVDAILGSDDDYAGVADKDTFAGAKMTDKDTLAATAAMMDKYTLAARAEMMDKDITTGRVKMMHKDTMSEREGMKDKDTMAEMPDNKPSFLSDEDEVVCTDSVICGDFEYDSDSSGEPCAPDFVCNDVVFSPTGMEDADLDEIQPITEDKTGLKSHGLVEVDKESEPKSQDALRENTESTEQLVGKSIEPEDDQKEEVSTETETPSQNASTGKIKYPELEADPFVETEDDQIVVPRVELKSWMATSIDVQEIISICSNCSPKNDEMKKLSKSIRSYLQMEENAKSERKLTTSSEIHETTDEMESVVAQEREGVIEDETIPSGPEANIGRDSDEEYEMAPEDLPKQVYKIQLEESEKAEETQLLEEKTQVLEVDTPTVIRKLSLEKIVEDGNERRDDSVKDREKEKKPDNVEEEVSSEGKELGTKVEEKKKAKDQDKLSHDSDLQGDVKRHAREKVHEDVGKEGVSEGKVETADAEKDKTKDQEKLSDLQGSSVKDYERENEHEDVRKETISDGKNVASEGKEMKAEEKEKLSKKKEENIKSEIDRKTMKEKERLVVTGVKDEFAEEPIISGEEWQVEKDQGKEFIGGKLQKTERGSSIHEAMLSTEQLEETPIAEGLLHPDQLEKEVGITEGLELLPIKEVEEDIARKELGEGKVISELEKEITDTEVEKAGQLTSDGLAPPLGEKEIAKLSEKEKLEKELAEQIAEADSICICEPKEAPRKKEKLKRDLSKAVAKEDAEKREETVCTCIDENVSQEKEKPRSKLIIIRRTICRRSDQEWSSLQQKESTSRVKKTKTSYIQVKDESMGTVVSVGLQTEKNVKKDRFPLRKMREAQTVSSDSIMNSSCNITEESCQTHEKPSKKHKEPIESESRCFMCKKVISSKNAVHISSDIQIAFAQKVNGPKSNISMVCCTCKQEQDLKLKILSKEKTHSHDESKKFSSNMDFNSPLPSEIVEEVKINTQIGVYKKRHTLLDKKDQSCLAKLIKSKTAYRERRQKSDSEPNVKYGKPQKKHGIQLKSESDNTSRLIVEPSSSCTCVTEKTSSVSGKKSTKGEKQFKEEENLSCHCDDSD